MEIYLKFNSRIELIYHSQNKCEFLFDKSKKVVFYPLDIRIYICIMKLVSGELNRSLKNCEINDFSLKRLIKFIAFLEDQVCLDYLFKFDENVFIVSPTLKKFQFPDISQQHVGGFKICSNTYVTFDKNNIILNNPFSDFKIIFPRLDIFSVFLKSFFQPNCLGHVEIFFSLLVSGNFITNSNSITNKFYYWEIHDLIFHSNSRLGTIDDSYNIGGTFRFKNNKLLPCISNELDERKNNYFELIKPINVVKNNFFEILQKRKSNRNFTNDPINEHQISSFLYYTCFYENSSKRLIPSAGAIHDLEFYLLINKSDSFQKDIYYYNAFKHGLSQLNVNEVILDEIIHNSCVALGTKSAPQIIVIVTSKFEKCAWKYERIAYRNTIFSGGAALQTMYLVAASLDLSACTIGSGNSDLFSKAIGIEHFEEPAILEFALGIS